MQKQTILLLEDDLLVGEEILFTLEANDHQVRWVKSIGECKSYLSSERPSLAIFDVNLGDGSALDFFSILKESNCNIPTIFLSANGTPENVVKALELGANDFIHKPISNKELILRVQTHLRLLDLEDAKEFEGAKLNTNDCSLKFENTVVTFSDRQIEILELFFKKANKVIKREELLEQLQKSGPIDQRTINSHISQIRGRLRKNNIRHISIESVYNVGYRLSNNED